MAAIEFRHDQLNPVLADNGEGDAFQRFVADTLRREYPQLHLFQTGGKDGAIDFSQTADSSRVVGETKKIGDEDVLASSQQEWRLVNQRLQKHLADPAGPTKGQSQYRPWYCADPAICEYLFCVSGRLANQSQRDTLHDEIKGALSELASAHTHLQHLGQIDVKVLDWGDFETRLAQQPHLKFRWFPRTRPSGLTPIDAVPRGTGFRAYLHEDRMPYFSRAMFRESPEADGFRHDIQDERALLALLTESGRTGIVLTGGGGAGKTRLGLELGRMALADGWTVLAVGNRLRDDALQELGQECPPDARVLLIFDYVETQRDFIELANELTDLSNQFGLQLHYVANCRSSYYHELEGAVDHVRVALVSPTPSDPADWTGAYRRAVVRHILTHGVPQADQRHEELCREVPVFAVFLSYLVEKKNEPWLQELLQEQDFGQWIAKRIQQTLPGQTIDRELALLMGLFPVHQDKLVSIRNRFGALIDRLAADEWISRLSDVDQTWATAHDVFADRILLSYLERIGPTAEMFVHELFDAAEGYVQLPSAFTALQRIADQAVVSCLPWPQIIEQRLTKNAQAWQTVRDLVVRTPLLRELQIIDLLGNASPVWQGGETDTSFQNAVGWLARWACRDGNRSQLDLVQQATLTEWVRRSAPNAFHSNYVLTYGLKWDCEPVRAEARRWLDARPDLFQTHFLLVAWLTAILPADDVRPVVASWLTKYALVSQVSFVVQAWLKATGATGVALVQEPIRAWLTKHQEDSEASHVYKSWLDAGGEKSLVQEFIRAWLKTHAADFDSDFVYRAWLENGGDFELVGQAASTWLRRFRDRHEAVFVTKFLAKQPYISDQVNADILFWCQTFPLDPDALWRMTALGTKLFHPSLAADLVATAESLLAAHSPHVQSATISAEQLDWISSYLINNRAIRTGELRSRVDTWVIQWIKHAASFSNLPKPQIQRPDIVQRIADLLYSGKLDVTADEQALAKFLRWLNRWDATKKSGVREFVEELSTAFPRGELWNKFSGPAN